MATEYRLTLAGTTLPVEVTERALPDPDERPTGTPQLLSADLYDRYGFEVIVRAGRRPLGVGAAGLRQAWPGLLVEELRGRG